MPDEERRDQEGRGAPLVHPKPLPLSFYARPASEVARDLLGRLLVSSVDGVRTMGRIVETEAYLGPEDDASHASARIGRTARNAPMFAAPGVAYVYRIYGIHWCLNAVTDVEGHPAAVLIRSAEPLVGFEFARVRRGNSLDRNLMRGPGNLCSALGVTGALNHHRLDQEPLWIEEGEPVSDDVVMTGPRVGVTKAIDLPLRFWIRDNVWVSRAR